MAASSITYPANPSEKGRDVGRLSVLHFTPSTSYPALGEPITASQFGLTYLDAVYATVADGTRVVTWDPVNGTPRYWTAFSTEAGTGTDQSAKTARVMAIGR